MKTNRLLLTAALCGALLMASATSSMAQFNGVSENTSSPKVAYKLSVLQTKPMQFRVYYSDPQSSKITIRITDAQDHALFSEVNTVSSGYLRYFDLSPLADGTYTFEIVDGKEKYNQSFDIITKTRRVVSAAN
jgi:hypothetical protein